MNESAPTWEEFLVGWELGLYRDPIICGVFVGIVLGYLGVFVVLKRMVFVTAAISQASGLGVALSFFAGIHLGIEVHPVIGALLLAFVASLVFSIPASKLKLSREALLGFVYVGTWAASLLVGDRIAQESHDIAAILFGSAVVVESLDVILVFGVGVLVLLVYFIWHRCFVFATFDPLGAKVQGLPVRFSEILGWILLAVEVSVATRALGVLPVFAFAVFPAMTALMIVQKRIRWALLIAACLGAFSGGAGYLLSFFLEFPVGASQATVAACTFVLCIPIRLIRS